MFLGQLFVITGFSRSSFLHHISFVQNFSLTYNSVHFQYLSINWYDMMDESSANYI